MTASGLATANLGFAHRHLLGTEGLSADEITFLLDLAEGYVAQNRRADKKSSLLRGLTVINLFFESSTRTRTSFELAGKRLSADVINMSIAWRTAKKGGRDEIETSCFFRIELEAILTLVQPFLCDSFYRRQYRVKFISRACAQIQRSLSSTSKFFPVY